MDRSSKQKINKETMALNGTLEQMDLTDIFRTFYSQTTEFTFCSSAHGKVSRIDHIVGPRKKPQQVQEYRSHTMHIFQPQHYETWRK